VPWATFFNKGVSPAPGLAAIGFLIGRLFHTAGA
jgi:hypothetical protein